MSYMVMECGLGYAIVLDSQGRFLKVVNCGYEVGQKVDRVITFGESGSPVVKLKRQISSLAALAACLCVLLLGSHQFLLTAYGTVRMQINPDVKIVVNRLDYVIDLEGMNEDGQALVESYRYFGKKLWKVSDELAYQALEDGFLKYGGAITLTVESKHEEWKKTAEKKLTEDIGSHLPDQLNIKISTQDSEDSQKPGEEKTPNLPESSPNKTETVPVWFPMPDSSSGAQPNMDEDDDEHDRDKDDDGKEGTEDERDRDDDDKEEDDGRDHDDGEDDDEKDDDDERNGSKAGREVGKESQDRDEDDQDDEVKDHDERHEDDSDIDENTSGQSHKNDDMDDEKGNEKDHDREEHGDDSGDEKENSQNGDDGRDTENSDKSDNGRDDDDNDREDDNQDDRQDEDSGGQDGEDDGDSGNDRDDDSDDD